MKYCKKCDTYKDVNEFHKNKDKPDGLQNSCKICMKEASRASYDKNKDKWKDTRSERRQRIYNENRAFIEDYKNKHPCYICGESENICLDFHHTDMSEKDNNVSEMLGHSRKTLEKEVSKCVVVCANCHRKIHAGLVVLAVHTGLKTPQV